jgi:hypothetical protein
MGGPGGQRLAGQGRLGPRGHETIGKPAGDGGALQALLDRSATRKGTSQGSSVARAAPKGPSDRGEVPGRM